MIVGEQEAQAQLQALAHSQAHAQAQVQPQVQPQAQKQIPAEFDPYGNYVNFARLRPRDRRELNRALKQGMTAKYVTREGKIEDLPQNMTRMQMRQLGRDQRTILAGAERGLGFNSNENDKQSQYANDVLRGFAENSYSPYITYTKKQEVPASKPAGSADASSTGATGTHTYTSTTTVPETGTTYRASFTFDGRPEDEKTSNPYLANQFPCHIHHDV